MASLPRSVQSKFSKSRKQHRLKVPTSEQIRMAQLLVDPKSEDHSILKDKVHKVMELCRCDEASALGALYDCDNDVEQAVDKLLEGGENQEEWIVQEGKKTKKVQQHQPNSDDLTTNNMNDDFDNYGSKSVSSNRRRGGRGGTDGLSRFSSRSSGTGAERKTFGKENHSRVDNGGDWERGGFTRGRRRCARYGSDRGRRGRGFGGRGGRRGGGGFAQIDSWNAPPAADNNTWDNSMANTVSGAETAGGEWGKRNSNNTSESNTWNNSMTQQANNDYDWGGEEDWSKIRDGGLVVESSAVHKVTDKSFSSVASSTTAALPIASPNVLSSNDAACVREESVDVTTLFGPDQRPAPQQQPQQSTSSWTSSKQATGDLKNELEIDKGSASALGNSDPASHLHHNRNSIFSKSNLKVELPLGRSSASIGLIDVQFGDMTLMSDSSQMLFDFNAPANGYQSQMNVAPSHKEQSSRQTPQQPQQQQQQTSHSVYQRSAGGDHVNGPDLSNTTKAPEVISKSGINPPTTYQASAPFGTSSTSEHQSISLQQQPVQLQKQQHYGSSRVSQSVNNQISSSGQQKNVNSGYSDMTGEQQRLRLNNSQSILVQQTSTHDSAMSQQYWHRDETLAQMNMSALDSASDIKGQVNQATFSDRLQIVRQSTFSDRLQTVRQPIFSDRFAVPKNEEIYDRFEFLRQLPLKPPTSFIDTHCHLQLLFERERFCGKFADYKKHRHTTWPRNFEGCITNWCFPEFFMTDIGWENLLEEDDVYGAFGCHPHCVSAYTPDVEDLICTRLTHPKVLAAGEMGLDYSRNNNQDHTLQKRVLRDQLKLGINMSKPLLIHCRNAEDDCFEIMKEIVPHDYPIHRHCFVGEYKEALRWTDYFTKLKIGLTTCVVDVSTFSHSSDFRTQSMLEILRDFPLDRILIETDSPYFLPNYYRQNECGNLQWNHPGMAMLVVLRLSEARNMGIIEALEAIRENTKALYQI